MPSRIYAPGLLDGCVVVVTGGGSGLGRATAQELSACGATVVVAGRRLEPLEETAARSAVENLMRVLSIEWARFNIKTTAIASGHFRTDALKKYPEPVQEGVARTVPLQRLGEPEEQAWLVAYLASPAGDYFSGTTITIDGARDNWFGPWPPPHLTDAEGKPLAEERRKPL